jgi:alpha-glucosidase
VRAHLAYLADLGVDAVWFNPWYASPQADAGYDVADYRAIDPLFGTLAEAEALIREAHELGIRIVVDIVPNHVSSEHVWFQAALAEGPGGPSRDLFWFRPGRGPSGELPPNNWASIFGGPAWTRTKNPDGTPGEWYLHLFAPGQPDVNWADQRVHDEFTDVLRFWFDRGADGVRIDSAALLMKDPSLDDFDVDAPPVPHPYADRDEVHDVYRAWRAVADSYDPPRALIGEVWLPDAPDRFALYLRPDELHTAFNFDFLGCPVGRRPRSGAWSTTASRCTRPVNAPATWVLSNHDVVRHVTRYGRAGYPVQPRLPPARGLHLHFTGYATGPRGGAAAARAARFGVPLPGRGARAVRGGVHPGRAAAGPDVLADQRGEPGPRRLPRAAAVVGVGIPVRLQPPVFAGPVATPNRTTGPR